MLAFFDKRDAVGAQLLQRAQQSAEVINVREKITGFILDTERKQLWPSKRKR